MTKNEIREKILKEGITDSFQMTNIAIDNAKSFKDSVPSSIFVDVVSTHSDTPINFRLYPKRFMRAGTLSWLLPHPKPVLKNHDDEIDPLGRVVDAKYVTHRAKPADNAPEYAKVGTGHQELKLKIGDRDAIEKILDGRLLTGSVRFRTDHLWCSICGHDLLNPKDEEGCIHWPGKMYDGEQCLFTTGNLDYKEYSFVNMPADALTTVISVNQQDSQTDSSPTSVFWINMDLSSAAEEIDSISPSRPGPSEEPNTRKEGRTLTRDELKENKDVQALVSEAVAAKAEEIETDCKAKIEELESVLADAAAKQETLKGLEEAQAALAREKDEVSKKADSLQEELTKKDEQVKQLTEENSTLRGDIHRSLAERLADLRISHRRETVEKRDEVVEKLVKRSAESLRDSIADILGEPSAPTETIPNPGLAKDDDGRTKENKKGVSKTDLIKEGLGKKGGK